MSQVFQSFWYDKWGCAFCWETGYGLISNKFNFTQNWLTTNLGDDTRHIPIISLIQVTVQTLHEMAFILSINKWENWGPEKLYGLWNLALLRGLDADYAGLLPPSTNVLIFIKELVGRQIWVQNIRFMIFIWYFSS